MRFVGFLPQVQVLLMLSGCGALGDRMPSTDASVPVDGGSVSDLDGDGLCNATEMRLMTDPENRDSDGDDVPDYVDGLAGTGRNPQLPDWGTDAILFAGDAREVVVPLEVTVNAEGQDFVGVLEASAMGGVSARDYLVSERAVFGQPTENVGTIGATTFRGVRGRTRLAFEFRFRFAGEAQPCARRFPMVLTVKRSDGVFVGRVPSGVMVFPSGATRQTVTWCQPVTCQ